MQRVCYIDNMDVKTGPSTTEIPFISAVNKRVPPEYRQQVATSIKDSLTHVYSVTDIAGRNGVQGLKKDELKQDGSVDLTDLGEEFMNQIGKLGESKLYADLVLDDLEAKMKTFQVGELLNWSEFSKQNSIDYVKQTVVASIAKTIQFGDKLPYKDENWKDLDPIRQKAILIGASVGQYLSADESHFPKTLDPESEVFSGPLMKLAEIQDGNSLMFKNIAMDLGIGSKPSPFQSLGKV